MLCSPRLCSPKKLLWSRCLKRFIHSSSCSWQPHPLPSFPKPPPNCAEWQSGAEEQPSSYTPCQAQELSLKQATFVHQLPLNSSFSSEPFLKKIEISITLDALIPPKPCLLLPSPPLFKDRVRFCITKFGVQILALSQGDHEFFLCPPSISYMLWVQPFVCTCLSPHYWQVPTTCTLTLGGIWGSSHIAFLENPRCNMVAWTVPLWYVFTRSLFNLHIWIK